jgi:hypothetical protein
MLFITTKIRRFLSFFSVRFFAFTSIALLSLILIQCKKDSEPLPPQISLIFEAGCTNDGDVVAVGKPIKFKVQVTGTDANITNFTIKKTYSGITKTVLDEGMNTEGFTRELTFYQSIEEQVVWTLAVMDRNRTEASVSITVNKDPNSLFGGIYEFPSIIMGYQSCTSYGHFFLPLVDKVYYVDSAAMYQNLVDVLVYFNYRDDNGIMKPSPTFSSPGEEPTATGELYELYYTDLTSWTTRNYTKYDIRAVNDVTADGFDNAHNDSLLIVSYDDVWGKKKYKWACAGTFIPIQTAAGKRGIIKVLEADTVETGTIRFALKLQM